MFHKGQIVKNIHSGQRIIVDETLDLWKFTGRSPDDSGKPAIWLNAHFVPDDNQAVTHEEISQLISKADQIIAESNAKLEEMRVARNRLEVIRAGIRRRAIYMIRRPDAEEGLYVFGPANWEDCRLWLIEKLGEYWHLQFPYCFRFGDDGRHDYELHIVEERGYDE